MSPQLFSVPAGGDADDAAEEFEDLPPDPASESQARSTLHGKEFDALALEFLEEMGATLVERYPRVESYTLDFLVEGANGRRFLVAAHGTPDRTERTKAGLRRQDTMLKFGFKALRLAQRGCPHPLLLVTSHMPKPGSSSEFLLSELNDVLLDAVPVVGDLPGRQRLHHYFSADLPPGPVAPLAAPWRAVQLGLDFDFDAADTDTPETPHPTTEDDRDA